MSYKKCYLIPSEKNSFIQRNKMEDITVRPDSKGRINLGDIAQGVSSYRVSIVENGKLILTPYVEIPLSEKWIFEDKEILERVKEHLKKVDDTPSS